LLDFDRLAAAQRVVAVDREKIVEKEVSKGVLVPVNNIRNELAMSLLVEKLILEIKRIKKDNPNVKLNLEDDVALVFFTELFDKQNVNLSGDFQANLKKYTEEAIRRFTKNGGKWSTDHELMLHTVLSERFAMANTIKYANEEILKAKALAELKGAALREKEQQFQSLSKTIQDLYRSLNELQNSGAISERSLVSSHIENLGGLITSSFTVRIGEPTRILGDFEGSGNDFNRLLSFLRERDSEVELLKTRLIDTEKKAISVEFSGVDAERTIAALRQENAAFAQQIDNLKSSVSQSGASSDSRVRELELKLKTANSRIQELESQLRSSELQLKQLRESKDTGSSRVDTNLVSSQYSSSSSSNRFGTTSGQDAPTYGTSSSQQPSYGGIAGTATTTSTYQTSGNRPTGTTPATSTSGNYGTYGTSSGTGAGSRTGTGATTTTPATTTGATTSTYGTGNTGSSYGTLGGSRTGTGATTTTPATTTGATTGTGSSYGTLSGSRTGATTTPATTTGATGSSYGSGSYGSGSYGSRTGTGATTTTTTGATTTSATGVTSSTSGQYRPGASYGTAGSSVTSSQSGASYGQGASSSISSSSTGQSGTGASYSSSYQRTTGTGLSGSGAGNTSSGSSYSFQTKRS